MRPADPADTPGTTTGTTIGVAGRGWRGTVTPWGAVVPHDGSPVLDWWLASEERWHTPADEPSVRQRLVDGVPVVETSLRVPGGDALHRVYAVAASGGLTVVEVENRSGRSFAVAFSRRDVRTGRPIADVPVEGIAVPADAWVSPVAHGASVRIALAHDGSGAGPLPADLPGWQQVARGWAEHVAGRLRVSFRDLAPPVKVPALRAALVLDGPPDVRDDAVAFLLAARELAELGHDADALVDAAAGAIERVARAHRKAAVLPWDVAAALDGAPVLLMLAGDDRASSDAVAVRRRLAPAAPVPDDPPGGHAGGGVRALAWLRSRMAVTDPATTVVDVLPAPFPAAWLGRDVEVHGLHVPGGLVSYALRWHGARPALLWEVLGVPGLRSSGLDPTWSTDRASGEALLGVPPGARPSA